MMNKTEAVYLNTVLRWMTGDLTVTEESAYYCAAELAERVNKTLGTGVSKALVSNTHAELEPRLRIPGNQLPAEIAALLAGIWAGMDSDGTWRDIVPTVDRLKEQGVNTLHPAQRRTGDGPCDPDEFADWDDEPKLLEFAAAHAGDDYAPPLPAQVCDVCDGEGINPDDGPDYDCDPCRGTGRRLDAAEQAEIDTARVRERQGPEETSGPEELPVR